MEALQRHPDLWDGHLLLLYRTEEERHRGVVAWVRRGLAGEADLSNQEVLGATLASAVRRPRGGRVEIRRISRRVSRVLWLLGSGDEIGMSLEAG